MTMLHEVLLIVEGRTLQVRSCHITSCSIAIDNLNCNCTCCAWTERVHPLPSFSQCTTEFVTDWAAWKFIDKCSPVLASDQL